MPRLIDYVGRFEFIRQAAFAVVRDEGVEALSREGGWRPSSGRA